MFNSKLLLGLVFALLSFCAQAQNTVLPSRTVSAVNTANIATISALALHDTLAIHAVCSAGTAALTVDVSADNVNFLSLDIIGAAATQIKQYTSTTVGATIALSPLTFPIIRLTVATCGGGNTSTLTYSLK